MAADGPNMDRDRGLAILAFKWFLRHNEATTKQSPMDIARERYAKGEITKEQFEQIKKDLG